MDNNGKRAPETGLEDGKDSRNDGATTLSAGDFARHATGALSFIEQAIIDADIDADAALISEGVLEVEFADGAKMIVNRHEVSREIWVAGRTGAYHFRWDGSGWVDTRSGAPLFEVVSSLASQMAGKPVRIC